MSKRLYLILSALAAISFAHATHYNPKSAINTISTQNIPYKALDDIFLDMFSNPEESKKLLEELRNSIDKGADVNASDEFGVTPLITAINYAVTPEAIKILIHHGAQILKPDSDGKLPIEHVEKQIKNFQEQLKRLVAQESTKKDMIDALKTRIENLQTIGQLVNPGRPAPAAPDAPIPADIQQILTAGATTPSNSASSNSAASTAKDKFGVAPMAEGE